MTPFQAQLRLAAIVRQLGVEKRETLEQLKKGSAGLERPDFLWHYLLQSFATMGRAAAWKGLIGNSVNYNRVTYEAIAKVAPGERLRHIEAVCREAGVRMPNKKADFILCCFERIEEMGGPAAARSSLLSCCGRAAKLAFLDAFKGIGPKYARNIMMDVYHPEFRDSIAIDVRIKGISTVLGVSFSSYEEEEAFYLAVAQEAGLSGWELDRILFNFTAEVKERLRQA